MGQEWMTGVLAVGLLAAPAFAGSAEDDLAVVKKAVGSEQAPRASAEQTPKSAARPGKKGSEPRWLKVRIEERSGRKARVSVNLPLDLVRAVGEGGEDWPLDSSHARNGKSIRLGDVLRALEAGREFVTIEDAEATLRVWVE